MAHYANILATYFGHTCELHVIYIFCIAFSFILTVLRHNHFLHYVNHLRDIFSSVTRQWQSREKVKLLHLYYFRDECNAK